MHLAAKFYPEYSRNVPKTLKFIFDVSMENEKKLKRIKS